MDPSREFLEYMIRFSGLELENGHKEDCRGCQIARIRIDVAERMLRDDDFPEGDVKACVSVYHDNVAFVMEQEGVEVVPCTFNPDKKYNKEPQTAKCNYEAWLRSS